MDPERLDLIDQPLCNVHDNDIDTRIIARTTTILYNMAPGSLRLRLAIMQRTESGGSGAQALPTSDHDTVKPELDTRSTPGIILSGSRAVEDENDAPAAGLVLQFSTRRPAAVRVSPPGLDRPSRPVMYRG